MPRHSAASVNGLTERSAWRQPVTLAGLALASVAIAPPAKAADGLNDSPTTQAATILETAFIPTERATRAPVSAKDTAPEIRPAPQFSSRKTRPPLLAQAVTSANDGTGTVVTQTGDTFDITGGTQAGANLFHSFEQLGLSSGQVANILSSPNIENILGRVVGGDPSVINGMLQVIGGDSNLFLINPAGIIFGPNAQISVPGSFTAASANGIQLDEYWFNAMGSNDYANLVGAPSGFAFTNSESGAVINAGNITVPQGESVTLLGGFVVNTGTVKAPGGIINIAAVPGENLVRISQEGSLLSLDLPVQEQTELNPDYSALTVSEIPALLTGGVAPQDLGLVVENGVVRLASTNTVIPTTAGTTIASGRLDAADMTADGLGGRIDVFGERVGLVGANLDVSGMRGGGLARIGGNYQGQGTVPNASNTYVSQGSTINADAIDEGTGGRVIIWAEDTTQFYGDISVRGGHTSGDGGFIEVSSKENLTFAGEVELNAPAGTSGTLLLDPNTLTIVDKVDGVGSLDGELTPGIDDELFAEVPDDGVNTISVGQLEAFGADANIQLEAYDGITIEDIADNSLDLQLITGAISFEADADNDGIGDFIVSGGDTIKTNGGSVEISGVNISTGDIETFVSVADTSGGSVALSATGNIFTGKIITKIIIPFGENPNPNFEDPTRPRGGSIIIDTLGDIRVGNIETAVVDELLENVEEGGTITIGSLGDIEVGNIDTAGGFLEIFGNNIRTGDIDTFSSRTNDSGRDNEGSVTLESSQGNIVVDTIRAGAGGIDIKAAEIFRAVDTFEVQGDELVEGDEETIFIRDRPELLTFFESLKDDEGNPLFTRQELLESDTSVIIEVPIFPVSVSARPATDFENSTASISIQHGGESIDSSSENIQILGSGGDFDFVVGPRITTIQGEEFALGDNLGINDFEEFAPASTTSIFLVRNEESRVLEIPGELPENVSGTVGGILRGPDTTNLTLYSTIRDIPFVDDGNGGEGNGNSVENVVEDSAAEQFISQSNELTCEPSTTGPTAFSSLSNREDETSAEQASTTDSPENPCIAINAEGSLLQTDLAENSLNPNQVFEIGPEGQVQIRLQPEAEVSPEN